MNGLTSRSRAYHSGPSRVADHYVYRCYDADGLLLYVGCTSDVARRMADHKRGHGGSRASVWLAACMTRYEVAGPFRGRDAGREAERKAIGSEQPLFNTQERRTSNISFYRNAVGRYLVAHGLRELALATACTCWREDRDAGVAAPWCAAHRAMEAA